MPATGTRTSSSVICGCDVARPGRRRWRPACGAVAVAVAVAAAAPPRPSVVVVPVLRPAGRPGCWLAGPGWPGLALAGPGVLAVGRGPGGRRGSAVRSWRSPAASPPSWRSARSWPLGCGRCALGAVLPVARRGRWRSAAAAGRCRPGAPCGSVRSLALRAVGAARRAPAAARGDSARRARSSRRRRGRARGGRRCWPARSRRSGAP